MEDVVRVYRQKTRSDEEIRPEDLKDGLVVWMETPNGGREERVCFKGSLLSLKEYAMLKQEIAAYNRSQHAQEYAWRGERASRGRDHFFFAF